MNPQATTSSSSSSNITGNRINNGISININNALLVNEVQKGNPVLNHIKNVKWIFSNDIIPDYVMGTTCALFISVKYHFRHPKHILRRIQEVGKNYRLRILLVYVDDESNLTVIQELNKIAFTSEFTMIMAWSNMECGRYLETFKAYENKSATSIQAKQETEYLPKVTSLLTTIKSVNKSDVSTLLDVFSNVKAIMNTTEEELLLCPGLGEKKVKRLYRVFHQPLDPQKFPKRTHSSNLSSKSKKINPQNSLDTTSSTTEATSANLISTLKNQFIDSKLELNEPEAKRIRMEPTTTTEEVIVIED